jgi:hypothetical protein
MKNAINLRAIALLAAKNTKGANKKIDTTDWIPRETLEKRLEKTPSNARSRLVLDVLTNPKGDAPSISHRETKWQAVKTSTTLDSDSPRKIPRARSKSGQKSHTANCGKAYRTRKTQRVRDLCFVF